MISICRLFGNTLRPYEFRTILHVPFSSHANPPKSSATTTEKIKSEPSQSEISVPGLSPKVLSVPSVEIGPGASKSGSYKNPEYFSYHPTSYFDAELEMAKYRLPQPSANYEEALHYMDVLS